MPVRSLGTRRAPERGVGYVRRMADQPVSPLPVDFSTHVLSLASSALIALGKMPAPDGKPHPLEPETARHLIDVLAMLEQKTKGNLEESEAKMLASLIYDLRVAFVDAQPKAKAPA
jgi:hypothetical protein